MPLSHRLNFGFQTYRRWPENGLGLLAKMEDCLCVDILNFGPHLIDVLLKPGDGDVGGHTVRDKQLVAPRRDGQQLFQFDGMKVRGRAIGLLADVRAALHTLLRLYASVEGEAL